MITQITQTTKSIIKNQNYKKDLKRKKPMSLNQD